MTIEHLDKIGLGTWDADSRGGALNDLEWLGFSWHYTWTSLDLWDADTTPERSSFVGMLWDETHVTSANFEYLKESGATALLGFNEPDNRGQANMSVQQALDLWPQLMATGLRLGSPATTMSGTLGSTSWLGRFMEGAEERGLRVDFVAVHFYSETGDIGEFRAFLRDVYAKYGKPIWVTEWCLADWSNPRRHTAAEQAAFARAGTEMMDDLPFVEKHAWYAAYDANDGLQAELFTSPESLSVVGKTFLDLLTSPSVRELRGSSADETLTGTSACERIYGLKGNDKISGGRGHEHIMGGAGRDALNGGAGVDLLEGGLGADTYIIKDTADTVLERAGGGRDHVHAWVSMSLDRHVEDLTLRGNQGISGTGNASGNRITGNSAANTLHGREGADILVGGGGKDIYILSDRFDQIIEAAHGGSDLVKSSVSFKLGAHLENLLLIGTARLSGSGNGLENRMTGNAAANVLKGAGGDDVLMGAAGNDKLLGGSGHDWMSGGDGADTLDGGKGADVLFGRAGADTFLFRSGWDYVMDFEDNIDTLHLDDALWGGRAKTVSQVLAKAEWVKGGVELTFDDWQTLRIEGIKSIAALKDDLVIV